MPVGTYKAFFAACGLAAALFVGQMPAHAGGLLNSLGSPGAVVNGMNNYNNSYYSYYQQQLRLHQLQQLQLQMQLQQLQNSFHTYLLPNGRSLDCVTTGSITSCY